MSVLGHEAARNFTPPLRELTPETSHGFRVIAFARIMLRVEPDPWQCWFWIHALELNPDGSYRFRTILLLVARQNGKTTAVQVLFLWALFTGRAQLAVGTAQDLGIARRTWHAAIKLARGDDELRDQIAAVRKANGQEMLELASGAEYIIQATNEDAGRGLQGVDLLHLDELRTHTDDGAWSALTKTTMARPNSLTICTSNAGSDVSVVLNRLHAAGLATVTGDRGADPTLFLAEYSAPDGCDLDDPQARAMANPSLGHGRLSMAALDSAQALDPPAVYRTECLCQRVDVLDSAVDLTAWKASRDTAATIGIRAGESPEAFAVRRKTLRLAACVDVAPDGAHVTLAIAAMEPDGRVRIEIAAAWKSTQEARAELPALLKALKPKATAWFPNGPSAALAPTLRPLAGEHGALSGAKVAEVCMHFADLVRARRVLHSGDPLLDAHVGGAARLHSGDGWRFTRSGSGHADAAYAAAGAVYLAVTTHRAATKAIVVY